MPIFRSKLDKWPTRSPRKFCWCYECCSFRPTIGLGTRTRSYYLVIELFNGGDKYIGIAPTDKETRNFQTSCKCVTLFHLSELLFGSLTGLWSITVQLFSSLMWLLNKIQQHFCCLVESYIDTSPYKVREWFSCWMILPAL